MTRLFVVCVWVCGGISVGVAGEGLPRYKFTPGQQLVYQGESSFKFGEGKSSGEFRNKSDTTVWVLKTNGDGSARILVRTVVNSIDIRDGKERVEDPTTRVFLADLFPDGRVRPDPSQKMPESTQHLFPRLPATAEEVTAGWTHESDDGDTYTAKPIGEGRFTVTHSGVMDKIYLSTSETTFTFDPAAGRIRATENQNSQGYGFNGKGTGATKFVSETSLSDAERTALEADVESYFAARKAYSAAMKVAKDLPARWVGLVGPAAKAVLKPAIEAIQQPDLKTALQGTYDTVDRYVRYTRDDVERKARVVGKPIADVKIRDMTGTAVDLNDHKGKVLVLDFWYRGCGWCVKAMPQMNQLTEDFADQPVVILGMNTDREKKDAEFVIDQMQLKYQTLCIKNDVPDKFGVQGFPTLVLVDANGVVRELHVGYSPTLRADVGAAIRKLVAETR